MILAVDIGGTKTLVASFNEHGDMTLSRRFPTSQHYADFVVQLTSLIKKEFWSPEVTTIHIAVAGYINYDNCKIIRLGNLPWENVDLANTLAHTFGVPVLIDNDANMGGLAEAHELRHMPDTLLYITIGTGIGSGIITNGEIDPFFAHSEAGHMMLEHNGIFQRWEDLCSGRAIMRDYGKRAADIDDHETWKEISYRLSLGFLAILPVVQPDIVVIGGGVGTHFEKYGRLLSQRLHSTLPSLVPLPPIVKAVHTEEAVVYGCYLLAKQTTTR